MWFIIGHIFPCLMQYLLLCFSVCIHNSAVPLSMDIVFYEPRLKKLPITGPLWRGAIDGFPNGCRWVQGAIGTGPWSAALF